MSSLTVSSEYGYVLGVFFVSALHLLSLSFKVGYARIAAGLPYPYLYAEKAEAEVEPLKNKFNCIQRAHQNSLEFFPVYSVFLLIGGLRHPKVSALSGVIYLLGRIIYVRGYSTGNPNSRLRGAWAYLALMPMVCTSSSTIYNLVRQ